MSRGFKVEKGGRKNQRKICDKGNKVRMINREGLKPLLLAFKTEKGSHKPRNAGQPLETEKSEPPASRKKCTWHFGFRYSIPKNCKVISLCCFKPWSLWSFVRTAIANATVYFLCMFSCVNYKISIIISWSLTLGKTACLGNWNALCPFFPVCPFGDHTLFSTLNVYTVIYSQQDHIWLCLDNEPQIQNTVVFEWECYSLCSFLDLGSNPSTIIYWLSGHSQLSSFSEPPFLI